MRATEITEAMGVFSRLGQQVASKFGSPQAKGKLEADDMARHMINLYNQYLGTSKEQATRDGVLKWLQSKGYPTEKAEQVVPGPAPAPPSPTPPPGPPPAPGPTPESITRKSNRIGNRLIEAAPAAPVLNKKQITDMLTAAANEFVSSGYKLVSVAPPPGPPAPPKSTLASWTPKVTKAASMFNSMSAAEQTFFKSLFGPSRPSGTSTIAGMTQNILKLTSVYNSMEEEDRKFFDGLIGLP